MNTRNIRDVFHRIAALALAGGTLWVTAVTAGATTAGESAAALWAALPVQALKWELGDLRPLDDLSPAAVLAISQSPLLVSAHSAVHKLVKCNCTVLCNVNLCTQHFEDFRHMRCV